MTWNIDHSHSQIEFTARHMMISKVRGRFEKFEGVVNYDAENPTNTTVNITIDTSSIYTRSADRDNHLKSPDFLTVEQYPAMTFVSKRVEKVSDNSGKLIGDLTIKDVTREVVLDVEYAGEALSPWGAQVVGFSGHTKINRKDWGLVWNVALETGGLLVSETVEIDIELELVKQPETEAAVAA